MLPSRFQLCAPPQLALKSRYKLLLKYLHIEDFLHQHVHFHREGKTRESKVSFQAVGGHWQKRRPTRVYKEQRKPCQARGGGGGFRSGWREQPRAREP